MGDTRPQRLDLKWRIPAQVVKAKEKSKSDSTPVTSMSFLSRISEPTILAKRTNDSDSISAKFVSMVKSNGLTMRNGQTNQFPYFLVSVGLEKACPGQIQHQKILRSGMQYGKGPL